MAQSLRFVSPNSVVVGWDFSTGAVKALASDMSGRVLAEVRLPTDLWRGDPMEDGLYELNLMQLEGQARASARGIAAKLRELGRLGDWVAVGISATHHTAGRVDENIAQVRRAICWNDYTLAKYHAAGLTRLGGQEGVAQLIGGPWAIRYSLSHLVKDEATLSESEWKRTHRMLPHGSLAAGFLTGNFDVASVSAAASTGIMDFRAKAWCKGMLGALSNPAYRELAWHQLPRIVDHYEPVGLLSPSVAWDAGVPMESRPTVYPTSDDQQAGLVGGGAVDDGQLAIILGNSAVVNSSSAKQPRSGNLDVMCLNWGPYLWMRCYTNGAQFLDRVVGANPDWAALEAGARKVGLGAGGAAVLPFVHPEPSLGVMAPKTGWLPSEPSDAGARFRAALEALAYLIAMGVRQHEQAGQTITRVSVSGGIAKSSLMCEILASVIERPVVRLESSEGPALGAAVTALAAHESNLRQRWGVAEPYTVADAVAALVRFKDTVQPNPAWTAGYRAALAQFEARVR